MLRVLTIVHFNQNYCCLIVLPSMQKKVERRNANAKSSQETIADNINENISNASKIEQEDVFDDWDPYEEVNRFSDLNDRKFRNKSSSFSSFNGFVPTLYCCDVVRSNKDMSNKRSCGRGKILYGPVCIGRQYVISDR